MHDEQLTREANRLYWATAASVSEIADQLVMSRRALYDALEPRPAMEDCQLCGAVLVFRNRTALERRRAECPECETERVLDGATGLDDQAAPQVEQERVAARLSPLRRGGGAPASGVYLAGLLLAGLAAGATAGYFLRRR
jgi:hypothetical protein